MTKKEIAELTISIWDGGETTSQRTPDPREIYLVIDTAIGQLIHEDLRSNTSIDGKFFSPAEVLSVQYDATRNKKYTTLTSTPLLDSNGNAIILINPVQDDTNQFISATLIESFITQDLEVGRRPDVSWVLENDKVFYDKIPLQYSQVLIRMVKSILGISDTAVIPCPDHLINRVLDIVLQKFGIQQQQAEKVVNIYKTA